MFPALSSNLFTMNIYFSTLTSFLYPNLPSSFFLSCHSLFLSALPHLLLLYHLFSENMKIWNGRGNTAHHQIPAPSPGNRGTILKRESRIWHSLIQSLSHLLDSVPHSELSDESKATAKLRRTKKPRWKWSIFPSHSSVSSIQSPLIAMSIPACLLWGAVWMIVALFMHLLSIKMLFVHFV